MKTLTFVLYFVAILGLIEASWRVKDQDGFSSSADQSKFLSYVNSAMLQIGRNSAKMTFLREKMENYYHYDWHCFYGAFSASWSSVKSITVKKAGKEIMCFQSA